MNVFRLPAAVLLLACAAPVLCQQSQPYAFATGTADDEKEIRDVMKVIAAEGSDARIASNLDWENAFGIRYTDLAKRDAFYKEVVKPLQKDDTDATLEVKIRFIKPDVAVADEYWHIVGQLDVETRKPGPDRWGRSTDMFVKQNGHWLEVHERIADLRLPYYRHFDAMPAAVPVPADTLASYAGTYARVEDPTHKITIAMVSGGLQAQGAHYRFVLVPTSVTSFLVFLPDDLSEYYKYDFSTGADGATTITISEAWGEVLFHYKRVK